MPSALTMKPEPSPRIGTPWPGCMNWNKGLSSSMPGGMRPWPLVFTLELTLTFTTAGP